MSYLSSNKSTCVYLLNRNPNIISCEAVAPALVLPRPWEHGNFAPLICLCSVENPYTECVGSRQPPKKAIFKFVNFSEAAQ